MSVGLLYRFFDSKAAIIKAIIIEQVEGQLEWLRLAIENDTLDPGTASKLAMRALGDASVNPKLMAMMFEISAEVCRDPELRAFLRERHSRAMASLSEKLVERGADAKVAADTIARVDLASAIVSGLGTRAILHADAFSKVSLDEIQNLMDDVFASALDRKKLHSAAGR